MIQEEDSHGVCDNSNYILRIQRMLLIIHTRLDLFSHKMKTFNNTKVDGVKNMPPMGSCHDRKFHFKHYLFFLTVIRLNMY